MRIVAGWGLICLAFSSPSFALRTYHVGNSLTDMINSAGLANWVSSRGETHPYGYHIANGKGLDYIWNNPSAADRTVSTYGTHDNALPNFEWDVVTLEPFGANNNDAVRIADFVGATLSDSANSDTQFYLYEHWPLVSDVGAGTFTAFWEQPWTGSGGSVTIRTRDYFQQLADQVNGMSLGLEKDVLIVPAGDVMNELDKRMRAGDIPGFSSALDLYSDNVHLYKNVGIFVVSTTFYATLYKIIRWGWRSPAIKRRPSPRNSRQQFSASRGMSSPGIHIPVFRRRSSEILTEILKSPLWITTSGNRRLARRPTCAPTPISISSSMRRTTRSGEIR